jgi:hypothetical protein
MACWPALSHSLGVVPVTQSVGNRVVLILIHIRSLYQRYFQRQPLPHGTAHKRRIIAQSNPVLVPPRLRIQAHNISHLSREDGKSITGFPGMMLSIILLYSVLSLYSPRRSRHRAACGLVRSWGFHFYMEKNSWCSVLQRTLV